MVCIPGQTVVVIMDNTFKIKSTALVFISGTMGACMKVFGSRGNNTEQVNTYQKKVTLKLVSGFMENAPDGYTTTAPNQLTQFDILF